MLTECAAIKMYAACIRDKRYYNTYGDYPQNMGGASPLNIALCIYILAAFIISFLSYGIMLVNNMFIRNADAEKVEVGTTADYYSINPFEEKQKCTYYSIKYYDSETIIENVCPALNKYNVGDTVDVRYLRDKPDFAVIFEYVYDSNHKEDVYGFVLSLAVCIFVFF